MLERKIIITKLMATHVVLLPLILFLGMIFSNHSFELLIIDQTILVILFFAGYWEFFGLRFKLVFLLLFQIFILFLASGILFSGEVPYQNITSLSILWGVELILLSLLGRILIVVYFNNKKNVEISFPFQNGTYLVTDGGNSKVSRLMNYHFHSPVHKKKNTNLSMKYATDIVKITKGSTKFLPSENEDYPVFGETVFCPMEGTIVKLLNDIEDNIPFSGNYPYNTGNTIIIKNVDYYLLLGHLKKGSIVVKLGDIVKRNDWIGECGNSGMSERPHLHMQLIKCDGDDYWKGMGISMQFLGKNLYKNRLIRN